jgi:hypothetical protein
MYVSASTPAAYPFPKLVPQRSDSTQSTDITENTDSLKFAALVIVKNPKTSKKVLFTQAVSF